MISCLYISRGSSTLDSFSSKHLFYLFCHFLPLLPSAFPIFSSTLPHLLRYFNYHFPSRTPLVIILIVEGILVYRQKQKKSKNSKEEFLLLRDIFKVKLLSGNFVFC